MFEAQTYDVILQRMLDGITDDVDKREGSIIFDALAPAAMELAEVYANMDIQRRRTFAETADGDDLEMRANEIGVFKKKASSSIRKGIFKNTNSEPMTVPLASRFRLGDIVYTTEKLIEVGSYQMKAETAGILGNNDFGELIPVEPVDGLGSATLTDVLIPGTDEEPDEILRDRYRRNITDPDQDGNTAQYKEWAEIYEGVGTAKVFPLWNGGNTVKVAITNGLFQVANPTLVENFQEYLDPGSLGLGNGLAPIGSKVTITGGVKKDINVTGNIVLAEGYSEPDGVSEAINQYLASITYVKNSVSYMRTAVTILDTPSIADLSELRLNGSSVDVLLMGEDIPMLNSVNLTVVIA